MKSGSRGNRDASPPSPRRVFGGLNEDRLPREPRPLPGDDRFGNARHASMKSGSRGNRDTGDLPDAVTLIEGPQ